MVHLSGVRGKIKDFILFSPFFFAAIAAISRNVGLLVSLSVYPSVERIYIQNITKTINIKFDSIYEYCPKT